MKTKLAITLIIAVFITLFVFSPYAASNDKQTSGYYTTDMWLLGITPYIPIALDHIIIPGLISKSQIRTLANQGYFFAYTSNAYDVVISGSLVIVIYYINGMTSNIICLGDIVD